MVRPSTLTRFEDREDCIPQFFNRDRLTDTHCRRELWIDFSERVDVSAAEDERNALLLHNLQQWKDGLPFRLMSTIAQSQPTSVNAARPWS